MGTTIPALDPVTDILDTDKIMVTQQSGLTYTMSGANFNKRNQAVIANSTTLTGAPLKTGNIVRAYFTADITGVNTSTGLVLNYNGSNKNVKVPKNGALVNFTAQNMGGSPTVYKYLQAHTTLELLYDGTNFVIIGNPEVISSANYVIYADGQKIEPKEYQIRGMFLPSNSNTYNLNDFIYYLLDLYNEKLTSSTGAVIEISMQYSVMNTPKITINDVTYNTYGGMVRIQSLYKSVGQASFQVNLPMDSKIIIGVVDNGVLRGYKIFS